MESRTSGQQGQINAPLGPQCRRGTLDQAKYHPDHRQGSMEWAQEAGDTAMQGYLLLKKSQMAYDERDALRVLTLAQATTEGPWRLPVKARAEATQQEALGMAMLGEPIRTVEHKLGEAQQLLTKAADEEQHGLLGAYFSDHTLRLRNANCYTE